MRSVLGGVDEYTPPVVIDHGDLRALTLQSHLPPGFEGAAPELSFSGPAATPAPPLTGGTDFLSDTPDDNGSQWPAAPNGGLGGEGLDPGAGQPGDGSGPANGAGDPGAGSAPGAGAQGASAALPAGSLPFTGAEPAAQAAAGAALIAAGAAARRQARRPARD